jgi:Family of unknown function (DUF5367)
MKVKDSFLLLVSGMEIWVLGSIYYAYRGVAVLESGSTRYWISFCISPVVSAAICIAILRWRQIQPPAWASGMLLLAIPGMIGEALVLSHFSTFMPRVQESSAGRYGAFLFATYAIVLGIAEVVTLKAIP